MRTTLLLPCLALAVSGYAQPAPKVVFTGDTFVYNWQQTPKFIANKNWTGAGINTRPPAASAIVVADFQNNVINQHPAFVFIDTGWADLSLQSDANPMGLSWEFAADAIIQMVQTAQAAKIKVILGNVPVWNGDNFDSDFFNGWIQTYAASKNIPVVNFQPWLTVGCADVNNVAVCALATPNIYPLPSLTPTDAGYQLMTQMAQAAIATYGLTMKGGYLSNLMTISGTPATGDTNTPQVNSVATGAGVQFTAQATWSDGVTRPMLNTPYNGSLGTWWSTNPKVMAVNQQGFAYAYSTGTATIWFNSASGNTFSPWTMTVSSIYPQNVPDPQY
jgi:hypothetical protein